MAGQDNTTKSASRVSLDHFDPEGVRELSRTLSRPSPQLKRRSTRSDQTLAAEEPFSLERTLRAALERYGSFTFINQPSPNNKVQATWFRHQEERARCILQQPSRHRRWRHGVSTGNGWIDDKSQGYLAGMQKFNATLHENASPRLQWRG